MCRRAKRPLNKAAVKKADAEFYANHPELKGLPLSATDPKQATLRREWMDLYIKHGGEVEDAKGKSAKTCGGTTTACSSSSERSHPPLDKSKYPEQRTKYDYKKFFPNLGDEYEVLAPGTGDYNCIAHTLGKNNDWVNPVTGSKSDRLAEMDKLYAAQGYKRSSSMDFSYKPGTQKIVVYATKNPDGSIKEITHGAIQDHHGTWESKLGPWPLIRHLTPDALNGSLYGEPVAVYEK